MVLSIFEQNILPTIYQAHEIPFYSSIICFIVPLWSKVKQLEIHEIEKAKIKGSAFDVQLIAKNDQR